MHYSLHGNGARNPGHWRPTLDDLRDGFGGATHPEVGDLVAWRYAAWRVHEIRPWEPVDFTAQQNAELEESVASVREDKRAMARGRNWPFHLVLRHYRGPIIILAGEAKAFSKLRDGSNTTQISFSSWPHRQRWNRLPEPFRVCSCHGDPWPCQEIDQRALADHEMEEFRKIEASHAPGVCAACREPISTRQSVLTFPEPSRILPGAPGPSFHAGRSACWREAEEYERTGRLADNPDIGRLASCPGIRFIHEARELPHGVDRVQCTAGPFCTGKHGPAGYRRESPCWNVIPLAGNEGAYARPDSDCGYRQPGQRMCLGGDLSSGGTTLSPTAADLLWENNRRARE
jgi:hypothetical protein